MPAQRKCILVRENNRNRCCRHCSYFKSEQCYQAWDPKPKGTSNEHTTLISILLLVAVPWLMCLWMPPVVLGLGGTLAPYRCRGSQIWACIRHGLSAVTCHVCGCPQHSPGSTGRPKQGAAGLPHCMRCCSMLNMVRPADLHTPYSILLGPSVLQGLCSGHLQFWQYPKPWL